MVEECERYVADEMERDGELEDAFNEGFKEGRKCMLRYVIQWLEDEAARNAPRNYFRGLLAEE